MSIKKLEYEECLLVENIMNKLNEVIDEMEDQNQRINRIWKFLRKREEHAVKNQPE